MFKRNEVPCPNPNACGVVSHRRGSAEQKRCQQRMSGAGRSSAASQSSQKVAIKLPTTVKRSQQ